MQMNKSAEFGCSKKLGAECRLTICELIRNIDPIRRKTQISTIVRCVADWANAECGRWAAFARPTEQEHFPDPTKPF
jgi:hypothetical protein